MYDDLPSAPVTAGRDSADLDDGELIALVRNGSSDAFSLLFQRHRFTADRLARHLAPRSEADDIVAEAFAQVFKQLAQGRGPDAAFRAYLLTSVRNESSKRGRARTRVRPTDDIAQIDQVQQFHDAAVLDFETTAVRQAFESLPSRWKTVLWELDVKGDKPHEVADRLDLSPNGVSALAYRARAGMREAYVQQHLDTTGRAVAVACEGPRASLAAHARGSLSRRDARKVVTHLEGCADCAAALAELADVSSTMRTPLPR